MAIAFVQKSAQVFVDNGTSITPSLAGTTAGNFVVLTVYNMDFSTTSPQPALAAPAGWLTAVAPVSALGPDEFKPTVGIFYKENIAGGVESGTVNLGSSSYAMAAITEFSGVAKSSSLDVVASSVLVAATSGTSGTTAATSLATSLAIAAGCSQNGLGTLNNYSSPATVGYTSIYNFIGGGGHASGDHSYKILAATGAQTASWTWTESAYFSGAIAVFKGASIIPGSPATVPLLQRRRR